MSSAETGKLGVGQGSMPAETLERSGLGDSRIASFEGLRGVLALTVCIGHLGLNTVAERLGFHVRFELAVPLFFTLSGFVLARSYYFERRSFGRLFSGRVARLYPLHLLTLLWCVVLAISQHKDLDPSLLLQNLLLFHNVGLPPNNWAYNYPSWSISVEMLASLLFYFVLIRRTALLAPALAVAGIAGFSLVGASDLGAAENLNGVLNVGLLGGFAGFACGGAAYLVSLDLPAFIRRLRWLTIILLLAAALFFVLPTWSWLTGGLFGLCGLLLVTFLALNDDATLLSSKPFVYLGAISYSIYLIHFPVLKTAEYLFTGVGIRGLVAKSLILVVVLLASAICHRFFEMPIQRLLLRYMGVSHSRALSKNEGATGPTVGLVGAAAGRHDGDAGAGHRESSKKQGRGGQP